MTQRELNRRVARATGESLELINQRGFSPLDELPPERDPLMLDWEEFENPSPISLQRTAIGDLSV